MSIGGNNRAYQVKNPDKPRRQPPPLDLIDALSSIPCPSDSGFEDDEWKVLVDAFRYTGARLSELCGLRAEDVHRVNDIPIIEVKVAMIPLRRKGVYRDGYRAIPVHPRLESMLFARAGLIKSGEMFPGSGRCDERMGSRTYTHYGRHFSRLYLRRAREIWSLMHMHSWRLHIIHYFCRVAGVPEVMCEDILGYAHGLRSDRFCSGRAPMEILYSMVKRLP